MNNFRSLRRAMAVMMLMMVGSTGHAATLIAKNNGSANFNSDAYTNGVGTINDANFIANNLASYDGLGSNATIKLTMGIFRRLFPSGGRLHPFGDADEPVPPHLVVILRRTFRSARRIQ